MEIIRHKLIKEIRDYDVFPSTVITPITGKNERFIWYESLDGQTQALTRKNKFDDPELMRDLEKTFFESGEIIAIKGNETNKPYFQSPEVLIEPRSELDVEKMRNLINFFYESPIIHLYLSEIKRGVVFPTLYTFSKTPPDEKNYVRMEDRLKVSFLVD